MEIGISIIPKSISIIPKFSQQDRQDNRPYRFMDNYSYLEFLENTDVLRASF